MVYGTPKKGGYGGGLGAIAKKIAQDRQAQEAAAPPQSTYKPVGLRSLSEEITAAKEAGRAGPTKPAPRPGSDPHSQIVYPKKKEQATAQAQPLAPAKPRDLAAERANAIIIYPKKKEQPQAQAQPQPAKAEEQPGEQPETDAATPQ